MDVATKQDYPAQFRLFIANGLWAVASEVQGERWVQASHEQKEAVATRALHLLNFMGAVPDVWHRTAELMLALSPYMEKQGRWNEWLPYLQAGSQLARGNGDVKGAVKLEVGGAVFNRSMGRYGEARESLRRSAAQFAALGDGFHNARTLNLLAWTERLAGNPSEAQRLVNDALLRLQANDDEVALERARSYSILGAVFYDLSDWARAEEYYRKTLQVPQLRNDTERLAWCHADLGLALCAQENYEDALTHCRAALSISAGIQGTVQTAVFQMNLTIIYLGLKQPAEALEFAVQAQQIFKHVHDGRHLTMIEIDVGIAYTQLGKFDAAEQILIGASERAEILGYQFMWVNALDQLGLVYLGSGKRQQAMVTFQKVLAYLDSLPPTRQCDRHREELNRHLVEAQQAMWDKEKVVGRRGS